MKCIAKIRKNVIQAVLNNQNEYIIRVGEEWKNSVYLFILYNFPHVFTTEEIGLLLPVSYKYTDHISDILIFDKNNRFIVVNQNNTDECKIFLREPYHTSLIILMIKLVL